MRRILFTALASTALLATAPVLALARDHHRRHDRPHAHHARGHHARDHLRRFGSDNHVGGERTAGTVMSFTNGVLRIALNDGSTVSGSVTKATRLECEATEPMVVRNDDHRSGAGTIAAAAMTPMAIAEMMARAITVASTNRCVPWPHSRQERLSMRRSSGSRASERAGTRSS